MKNWKELYVELTGKLSVIENLEWVDLWHNQVNFLDNEHPFGSPAVFLSFRSLVINDTGTKVQDVQAQVDVYVYYETFLDTFEGAYNQNGALAFLDLFDRVNAVLHGSFGDTYSSMRRTAFSPVDTGGSGNLYLLQYSCHLIDKSAQKQWGEDSFADVIIDPNDPGNGFIID